MKKLKLVLKILGVVVVLLLLALAAVVFTFDPNNYKEAITAQVEKQTGRDFSIDGDISLSVFPWVGVQVEDVELANAEGFSDQPFARIAQLDVKVMLLPLLRKELQVDRVRLHGLFASLEVDKDGNNNWSDLAAREQDEAPAPKEPEQPVQAGEQAPVLAALAINGIELVDATVSWTDAQNDIRSSLSDFDLTTDAIRFNQPVAMQMNMQVKHNEPDLEALIMLTTNLTFNEAFTNIQLDALLLEVGVNAPDFAAEQLDIVLNSDINIDIDQELATLSDTRVTVLDAVLHAVLDVNGLLSEPVVSGTVHTDSVNGRVLLDRLGVDLPPMANDKSLTKLAYASRVKADAKQVELDDIKLNLDDTELTGWLHIPDTAQPVVRYKLHMSPIDADAYLPPASADAAVEAADGAAAAGSSGGTAVEDPEIALPVELLRTLDLQGELTMASVTVSSIPVTDILMKAQARGGVIRIDPLQLKSLEGSAAASAMINVKTDTPDYAIGLKASNMHPGPVVDPLLVGVFGEQDVTMDGAANVLADIKTRGTRVSQLKQAATGDLRFDMGRTVLQGVDFDHFVRNVVADYLATKSIPVGEDWRGILDPQTKTAFNRVHASAKVSNGDITNKDLILDSSRLKVKGEGVVNIMRNDMDYNALVDIEPAKRETTAEKLLDQPLAVRIHGPFEQLSYDVDKSQLKNVLRDLLEAEAKAKLNKEIEEEKAKLRQKAKEEEEELKQKLDDKLKDKLKGLF